MFDLAITCFTRCRKIFKKFIFLALPKTRFVTGVVRGRVVGVVRGVGGGGGGVVVVVGVVVVAAAAATTHQQYISKKIEKG